MADGAEFDRKGSDSARALAVQRERFSADDFSAETTQSFDLSSFHEAQQNGKDGSPHAPGHGNGSRPSQSELNLIGKDPIQRERFSASDLAPMISALRQLNHSNVRRFTKRNKTARTTRHTRQDKGMDQGCGSRSCPLDKNFAHSVEKKTLAARF